MTAPYLRATSRAAFRLVPEFSMNVVGEFANSSVSFEAIQMKRLGHRLGLLDAAGLDVVPAQQGVGRRPADARAGRALVANLPPRLAQVLRLRDGGRGGRAQQAGRGRLLEPPVALGVARDGTTLRTRLTFLGRRFARLAWGMCRPYVIGGGAKRRRRRLIVGMRRDGAKDPVIAAFASAQHGVVSRAQLRELGLSDGDVDRRVRSGRLHHGILRPETNVWIGGFEVDFVGVLAWRRP